MYQYFSGIITLFVKKNFIFIRHLYHILVNISTGNILQTTNQLLFYYYIWIILEQNNYALCTNGHDCPCSQKSQLRNVHKCNVWKGMSLFMSNCQTELTKKCNKGLLSAYCNLTFLFINISWQLQVYIIVKNIICIV